jgi:hypothetical protein
MSFQRSKQGTEEGDGPGSPSARRGSPAPSSPGAARRGLPVPPSPTAARRAPSPSPGLGRKALDRIVNAVSPRRISASAGLEHSFGGVESIVPQVTYVPISKWSSSLVASKVAELTGKAPKDRSITGLELTGMGEKVSF